MIAKRVEGLLIERPEGELLIVKESSNEAHALNLTAAIVFDLCDGATSKEVMAAEVARRTGSPLMRVSSTWRSPIWWKPAWWSSRTVRRRRSPGARSFGVSLFRRPRWRCSPWWRRS